MRLVPRLIVFIALLVPACGEGVDPARIDDILALDRDAAAGEDVYASCASSSCHGSNGDSGSGPRLSRRVPRGSDEDLIEIVLAGEGGMPPQDLDDQEMADLLAYLRQTFG